MDDQPDTAHWMPLIVENRPTHFVSALKLRILNACKVLVVLILLTGRAHAKSS